MPSLIRRYDHAKMYNVFVAIYPWVYLFLPLLNLVARHGAIVGADGIEGVTPGTKTLLWLGIAIVLGMGRVACLSFS